jgi:hypothetical protein
MENKSFAEMQAKRVSCIDWNDRMKLLKLIEYTRNASPGYGITAILENFMDENQDWQHTAIIKVKYTTETPSYNFKIDK